MYLILTGILTNSNLKWNRVFYKPSLHRSCENFYDKLKSISDLLHKLLLFTLQVSVPINSHIGGPPSCPVLRKLVYVM